MTRLLMIRVNKGVSVLCAKKFLKKKFNYLLTGPLTNAVN